MTIGTQKLQSSQKIHKLCSKMTKCTQNFSHENDKTHTKITKCTQKLQIAHKIDNCVQK